MTSQWLSYDFMLPKKQRFLRDASFSSLAQSIGAFTCPL